MQVQKKNTQKTKKHIKASNHATTTTEKQAHTKCGVANSVSECSTYPSDILTIYGGKM